MPLYEFRCETCGTFEQWRIMREASKPMLCPTCHVEAKRIYSVAGLMMSSSLRSHIEGSAEPRIIHRPESEKSTTKGRYHYPKGRPWMISH